MKNKINVTFLASAEKHLCESIRLNSTSNQDLLKVKLVQDQLNSMLETMDNLYIPTETDSSGEILLSSDYLPQTLWLRSAAASIIKVVDQEPSNFDTKLSQELKNFFHKFDKLYREQMQ